MGEFGRSHGTGITALALASVSQVGPLCSLIDGAPPHRGHPWEYFLLDPGECLDGSFGTFRFQTNANEGRK